jgi:hypothetical protein
MSGRLSSADSAWLHRRAGADRSEVGAQSDRGGDRARDRRALQTQDRTPDPAGTPAADCHEGDRT